MGGIMQARGCARQCNYTSCCDKDEKCCQKASIGCCPSGWLCPRDGETTCRDAQASELAPKQVIIIVVVMVLLPACCCGACIALFIAILHYDALAHRDRLIESKQIDV